MSVAERIPQMQAARAQRAAALEAQRAARDAFIQAQFPVMAARFEGLLLEALGRHASVQTHITAVVLPVQGRSFATLPTRVVQVRSTLTATAQTVTFTPRLDFRLAHQFGLIECSLDFDYAPRPMRGDAAAVSILTHGLIMGGSVVAGVYVIRGDGPGELRADDLEAAFGAWWLR